MPITVRASLLALVALLSAGCGGSAVSDVSQATEQACRTTADG